MNSRGCRSLHGAVREPGGEDAAWPAIRLMVADSVPTRLGKVLIVATPPAACAAP